MSVALAAAACLSLFATAQAAEFIRPDQSAGQVSVPAGETHKNLYTAGAQVTINGPTLGDLTVAGGNVSLNGPVSGGLFAGGGTVISNAQVSGTARIAGGNLNINGPVSGDLLAGGGNVLVTSNAKVGGDLILGGGNLNISSPVAGNAKIAGGTVYINSKISGEVNVIASKSLTFGPQAEVDGAVIYRGNQPAVVEPGAKVANIQFSPLPNRQPQAANVLRFSLLIQLAAYLILGFLLLHFRRQYFSQAVDYLRGNPWASLGIGLLAVIATPIIIILLFLTVVGYYLALLLLAAFVLALLVNTILAILLLGQFTLKLFNKAAVSFADWQVVLLGALLWEILKLIPVVGWLALAVICLMSFGFVAVSVKKSFHA